MFFKKKKLVHCNFETNPNLQIWTKWYLKEMSPKKTSVIPTLNELFSIFQKITPIKYSLKELSHDPEYTDQEHLIILFKLDEPFDTIDLQLIDACVSAKPIISTNQACIDPLMPLLYRYLIKYVYQFDKLYKKALDGHVSEVLVRGLSLLEVFMQYPSNVQSDAYELIDSIFQHLINTLIGGDTYLTNSCVHDYIDKLVSISFESLDKFQFTSMEHHLFLQAYLIFWVSYFGSPEFGAPQTEMISCYLPLVRQIPESEFKLHFDELILPIFDIAIHIISTVSKGVPANLTLENCFSLCFDFASFLIDSSNKDDIDSFVRSKNTYQHIITFFKWTLEHFPVLITNDPIKETNTPNFHTDSYPEFHFVHNPTFDKDVPLHHELKNQLTLYIGKPDYPSHPHISQFISLLSSSKGKYAFELLDGCLKIVMDMINADNTLQSCVKYSHLISQIICSYEPGISTTSMVKVGWITIFNLPIFDTAFFDWGSEESANIRQARFSLYYVYVHCFQSGCAKESCHIMKAIAAKMDGMQPQVFEEFLILLESLFKSNSINFMMHINKTDIMTHFTKIQFQLQALHSQDPHIPELRLKSFRFFSRLLTNPKDFVTIMGIESVSKFIFQSFFEKPLVNFAKEVVNSLFHIYLGLKPWKYEVPYKCMVELIKSAFPHEGEAEWMNLIVEMFNIITSCIVTSRCDFYELFSEENTLKFIAEEVPLSIYKNNPCVLNAMLNLLNTLSAKHLSFKNWFQKNSSIFENIVSQIDLDKSSINLMLKLIFEVDIDIDRLPSTASIMFGKALPFLHESIKHIEAIHPIIFGWIAQLCQSQFSNRLRIYQSKFLSTVIKYIQQFPEPSMVNENTMKSIEALIQIYTQVSSFLLKPVTLFNTLIAMKPSDNSDKKRFWYSQLFVSAFHSVLNNQPAVIPTSFFHLGGGGSHIIVPKLQPEIFQSGWTFMTRIEIGEACYRGITCLFSLITRNAKSFFELRFDGGPRKLMVAFTSKDHKDPIVKTINDFELIEPGKWYIISVCVNNSSLRAYMDSRLVYEYQSPGIRFDSKVKLCVGESALAEENETLPSSLVCSMSVVYLFSAALSLQSIKLAAKMPLDYIYDFSPSSSQLFPDLPSGLFSGDFTKNLQICYNARMCDKKKCFNLARTQIGAGTLVGHAMPFSMTLVGASIELGGLKVFMPLLDQVDISGTDAEKQTFLESVLRLMVDFLHTSEEIERLLMDTDVIVSLVGALMTISSDIFTETCVENIHGIYEELRTQKHMIDFVRLFWLNTNFMAHLSESTQEYIIDFILGSLLKNNKNLFLKMTTLSHLLAIISIVENDRIRAKWWSIVKHYIKVYFPIEDQHIFLTFILTNENTKVAIESLTMYLKLAKRCVGNCHAVWCLPTYFWALFEKVASPNEEFRLLVLDCLLRIVTSKKCEPPITDELLVPLLIQKISTENITTESWKTLVDLTLSVSVECLPLLAMTSYYIPSEKIQELPQVILSLPQLAKQIASYTAWYKYLFYIYVQSHKNEIFFSESSQFAQIFALIMYNMEKKNQSEVLAFLHVLQYTKQWDTEGFARQIHEAYVSPNNLDLGSIFEFMFLIPSFEPHFYNVQLLHCFRRAPNVIPFAGINTGFTLSEYLDDLSEAEAMNFTVTLNSRYSAEGRWLDQSLGMAVYKYLMENGLPKDQKTAIVKKSVSQFEIASIILGHCVRNDPALLPETIDFLIKNVKNENDDVAMALFLSTAQPVIEMTPLFEKLAKMKKPILASDSLMSALEFYGPTAQPWIESVVDQMTSYSRSLVKACSVCVIAIKLTKKLPNIQTVKLNEDLLSDFHEEQSSLHQLVSTCAKTLRHRRQEDAQTPGPWRANEDSTHWKLCNATDTQFRHIFLKPNLKFDLHKMASILRDEQNKEVAGQVYERWISAQPSQVDEYIDDDDDDKGNDQEKRDIGISTDAKLVTIKQVYVGKFQANSKLIFFEGVAENDETSSDVKTVQFEINQIDICLHRNYIHIRSAVEFFLKDHRSFFFFFPKMDRRKVMRYLSRNKGKETRLIQTSSAVSVLNELKVTEKWLSGALTNYEYLMYLNLIAGRSFNDLSQYPVFPWVISDYTSDVLNLTKQSTFRDLSKPIGALNAAKLEKLKMISDEIEDGDDKFLYRAHYMNGYYAVLYLMRLEPYTTIHIKMQDDKFDNADRIFHSIPGMWKTLMGDATDFRELIPEFFTTHEFLVNKDGFDLGKTQKGVSVSDVELPKWASSAKDFVEKNRAALESPIVTENLNHWIDLIFGFQQNGEAAVAANNTFHPSSYPDSVTREVMNDPDRLREVQSFAFNFGITPKQLFTQPHPKKVLPPIPRFGSSTTPVKVKDLDYPAVYMTVGNDNLYVLKENMIFASINSMGAITSANLANLAVVASRKEELGHRSFTMMKHNKMLVASSLWDSSFHFFRVESNQVSLFCSRQRLPLIVALCSNGNRVYTASRNMSIASWLVTNETVSQEVAVTLHDSPIIDLDTSSVLEMMVSCDKSDRVVLSKLPLMKYCRSFTSPYPINRVFFADDGSVVLQCQGRSIDMKSVLLSYSQSGEELARFELGAEITAATIMQITREKFHLMVATSDQKVRILSLPLFIVVGMVQNLGFVVDKATYNMKSATLYMSTSNDLYQMSFL